MGRNTARHEPKSYIPKHCLLNKFSVKLHDFNTMTDKTTKKVCKSLLNVLKEKSFASVLVLIADSEQELEKLSIDLKKCHFSDLKERQERMHREIAAIFARSQTEVIAYLETAKERIPITWNPMYLTSVRMNVIVLNGADLRLVEELASMDKVTHIEENGISTIC
ncbi:hypothetical protein Bhyg_06253 [Pseudolycoriella hygida]|uniref:Uncharacterized protein n=1 Tax=Pseudolycoriella hygida TaxID=35572 RepID=A0A9Q0N0A5_9DIPT|nr:hypothetical protein Bhyg_06253 [Pseudolycoriella hygida]